MAAFKELVKKLVFVWGAVSLAAIVGFIIFMAVSNSLPPKMTAATEESIHENSSGNVKLMVKRKSSDEENEILLTISQQGKTLISNYRLPIEKDEWFEDVAGSKIDAAGPGGFRITLIGVANDCDEATHYVYFLRYDGKMNLIASEMVTDTIRLRDGAIIGNRHFFLPFAEGHEYKHFIVPVEIRAGETAIVTSPLLSERGISLVRGEFEDGLKERGEKLKKGEDQEAFNSFTKTCRTFPEALREKSVAW